MTAHQRKKFRRILDREFPPGTKVFIKGRVDVFVVRPRNIYEKKEYSSLIVEKDINPFGWFSVPHYMCIKVGSKSFEPLKVRFLQGTQLKILD